jgi:hypothetical protein
LPPSPDATADATADRVLRPFQGPTCLGGRVYTSSPSEQTLRALGDRSAPAGTTGKSPGLGANGVEDTESTEFLAELMQEPPGGANHGRAGSSSRDPETERQVSLGVGDAQAHEFLAADGWGVITDVPGTEARGGGWQRAGGTTHRGAIRGDEHVDVALVRDAVEHEIGFTIDEIHSVYRQGRMTETQRELRGRIDARLLALSRSGANMAALARLLGFAYDEPSERFKTMERALARARVQEGVTRRSPRCDRCGRETPTVVTPCAACPA